MASSEHEAVVVGDGPAGSALAAALVRRGVDVLLVGRDEPWEATYGTWIDDLGVLAERAEVDPFAYRTPSIGLVTRSERVIERAYGVIDNDALRTVLRRGVAHRTADVDRVAPCEIRLGGADAGVGVSIRARVVVDARGRPAAGIDHAPVPRQTAIGVVLTEPPPGRLGRPMLMDWSAPAEGTAGVAVPTFAYALPVADGWLVEETVLAAHPAVDPDLLLPGLAARLDSSPDELSARARRIERVDIPMGGPLPPRGAGGGEAVVAFGAAASMIHPATGYSVASSLRRADAVAEAIADGAGHAEISAAVWPTPARRTRVFHDYGLDVLLRLDRDEIAGFFDAFFELPLDDQARYLRIETQPSEIAATMLRVFAGADWRLRRRLVSADLQALARLLRP